MRIALIKRRCSLRAGGSERYCVNLFRALRRRGHDVTVIGAAIDEELAGEIPFQQVDVSLWNSSTKNRSFAVNAGRAAREGRFDVVHGLGRAFGVDMVRVTERLQRHWVEEYYRPGIVRGLQRWNPRHRTLIDLEQKIYHAKSTQAIIVQSQIDRNVLIDRYGIAAEKIHIVANGVDTVRFQPDDGASRACIRREFDIADNEKIFLFAAHDFEGKGLRYLLEALFRVASRDWQLLVVGDGPVSRFRNVARRFGVSAHVRFPGRRPDIVELHRAADLCLLPTTYEPCPNVVLEAMACGTPALTTRTAGAFDFVDPGRTGYLTSRSDAVEEMTSAVEQFLSLSETDRELMSLQARQAVEPFTFDRNVTQTLCLMEEIHGTDRNHTAERRHVDDQPPVRRVA